MTTIDKIIKTIDTSKMEDFLDLDGICDELDIYEHVHQPDESQKLTYCYYHKWICTDTEVGIKVWYLNNEPVCISWLAGRKFHESFGWISRDSYNKTREYLVSLIKDKNRPYMTIITDETVNNLVTEFNGITGKSREEWNIIT